jgi:hypothetical protein
MATKTRRSKGPGMTGCQRIVKAWEAAGKCMASACGGNCRVRHHQRPLVYTQIESNQGVRQRAFQGDARGLYRR